MGIAISSKRFFTGVVWHTYSHDANFPVQLVVCFNSWSSPPTRLVRKMTIPYLDLCRKVTYLHINGLLSPPTPKGLHGSSPPPPFPHSELPLSFNFFSYASSRLCIAKHSTRLCIALHLQTWNLFCLLCIPAPDSFQESQLLFIDVLLSNSNNLVLSFKNNCYK